MEMGSYNMWREAEQEDALYRPTATLYISEMGLYMQLVHVIENQLLEHCIQYSVIV